VLLLKHECALQSFLVHNCRTTLYFIEASDAGAFEQCVLDVRASKEQAALERWQQDCQQLVNLQQMHEWLHQTHR